MSPDFRGARTGRPLGAADFVARLEALTGRILAPRKRGPAPGKPKQEVKAGGR